MGRGEGRVWLGGVCVLSESAEVAEVAGGGGGGGVAEGSIISSALAHSSSRSLPLPTTATCCSPLQRAGDISLKLLKARPSKAMQGQGKARQGQARRGKAMQGNARQGNTRQGNTRQGQDEARPSNARQSQGKARQGKEQRAKGKRLAAPHRFCFAFFAKEVETSDESLDEVFERVSFQLDPCFFITPGGALLASPAPSLLGRFFLLDPSAEGLGSGEWGAHITANSSN